ncbi:MAG: alpha/beta hydrolase domain-containing protein [Acidobacteriota bacterium]
MSQGVSRCATAKPRNLATILLFVIAGTAAARVVRVEVTSRADYWNGAYERIQGRVTYSLDPKNPHNAAIVDLTQAVEFTGDVDIVRPKNGGNGVLFVNVPNRGGRFFIRDTNPDEWYLRQGFTLAEVGWQFDVRADSRLLRLDTPVAKGIRGRVRSDFIVSAKTFDHSVAHIIQGNIGGTGYAVADAKDAVLTERDAPAAPRRTISPRKWRFTDDRTVHFDDGFVPGRIYEVIYTAADPVIVGAGLAAVRDFASYCKNDPAAVAPVKLAYAMGISQTGRFLRHLVWQGFNADEAGRKAYDALLIYVAGAGRGNFNHRFAQPSRDAQPLVPAMYPVDIPPFTDDGLLERARAEDVVPKIFYVNTAYEYWSRGASLIHTTPNGARDVDPPAEVRAYLVAGLGHVAGPFPPARDAAAQLPVNPNNIVHLRHGFAAALDAWTRNGVAPPPSRLPKIADGTLVPVASLPKSVAPRFAYNVYKIDLGIEPPPVHGTYTNLVPQAGPDGNELAGVRIPELQVPVATYTGWNLREPGTGFSEYRASFVGSFIAWPKDEVLARYRTRDEYFGRFTDAALALVRERFFVADDLPAILERGAKLWEAVVR